MLVRFITFLGAFLFMLTASAQETITVHVHDNDKGDALDFAYVNVYTNSDALVSSVITDPNGNAELTIKKYPVRLEVQAIGFEPAILILEAAPDKLVDIPLSKRFATLNEVVVTGVSAPTTLQNALSTYQIITKATMQAQGAVNVSDALKNQLNVNIGNDNILGSKISMQGMSGDKVKILIDGMPVSGREFGNVDLGQFNLNNVERIEIVQGPMSVVYGTDALGGVINIITRKDNLPWQFQAGTYYETLGKYNFDLSGSYTFKGGHQFSLGGGRNFFQGWGPLDPLERSFLWKPKEQYVANLSYNYAPANSDFHLQFANDFVKEKITDKDAHYTIFSFGAEAVDQYYENTRLNSRLSMNGKLGRKGSWQTQNGYSLYYRTRNTYVKDLVTLDQTQVAAQGAQDTTRFDDLTFRGSYSNSIRKTDWTVGYDVNLEKGRSVKMVAGTQSINDYALYLTTAIPFVHEKLVFQPAFRYAYNSRFQAPLIPSLNILIKATEDVQIRMSYGKGFRAPSLKELYLDFLDANHKVKGNLDLKAETGDHFQFSTSWQFYKKRTDFAKLLFTAYYNDVRDELFLYLIDPVNDPTAATYTNLARVRNLIGSLQAEGQWNNLHAVAGFSVTHIITAPNTPKAPQATLTLQYFWTKPGLNISTFYKYFGETPRPSAAIVPETVYEGTTDPYSFWDASIEKKFFQKKLQIVFGVKNLLDVQTATVNGANSGVNQAHASSGSEGENIAPGRSFFTSLRLTLQ